MDEVVHTGPMASYMDSLHPWIHDVLVGSIYRDDVRLGVGKKSVNFTFVLRSHEHTISDEEALHVQNEIIVSMSSKGCHIRSL